MGSGRQVTAGNPGLAVMSGAIGPAVQQHAIERMRRFFFYCSSLKVACDYMARAHSVAVRPQDAVQLRASHQVDTGLRDPDRDKLDTKRRLSASLSKQPVVTGHGAMDAAHFNNLGLRVQFSNALAQLALTDPGAMKIYEHCIGSCNDTRPMPQAVNLGPDKVIDEVHRKMINVIFSLGAANIGQVVTTRFAEQYINEASLGLSDYQARKRAEEPLLADLAGEYKSGIAAQQARIVNGAWDGVSGLCADLNVPLKALAPSALPLVASDYVEP